MNSDQIVAFISVMYIIRTTKTVLELFLTKQRPFKQNLEISLSIYGFFDNKKLKLLIKTKEEGSDNSYNLDFKIFKFLFLTN